MGPTMPVDGVLHVVHAACVFTWAATGVIESST
jgi:hypothetical protein